MINAFKYTKLLEKVGFSREQAEIQLQVISEIVESDMATKQDLSVFVERLEHQMHQMEYRIVVKVCTILVAIVGVAATLFKFYHP